MDKNLVDAIEILKGAETRVRDAKTRVTVRTARMHLIYQISDIVLFCYKSNELGAM